MDKNDKKSRSAKSGGRDKKQGENRSMDSGRKKDGVKGDQSFQQQ